MFDVLTWLRAKKAPAPPPHDVSGLTWREAERKLRAAGLSRSKAKRFISEFKRSQRRTHGE